MSGRAPPRRSGAAGGDELEAAEQDARERVEQAIERAREAAPPALEEAFENVFTD